MSFIRVLRTIFTADPSGFIKGANAVEQKLAEQARKVEASKNSLMNAFAPGNLQGQLAKIAAMVGGFSIAKVGVEAAANAEQFELAVGVMLGSGEKAKQLAADLEKFAAATPFELPEIQAATRKLLAADVAADDMTKTLTRLGNLAAGSGTKIDELASVYAKALGKGRLETEVINQFADRGIPLLKTLATQLGKTTGEVLKMAETGRLGLPELNRALEGLTGSGGKFDQMMLKQSRTLAGLWSTLKDTATMTLKGIAEELLKAFDAKGAIEKLTASIEAAKPQMIAAFKDLAGGIGVAFRTAQTLIDNALDAAQKLAAVLPGGGKPAPNNPADVSTGTAFGIALGGITKLQEPFARGMKGGGGFFGGLSAVAGEILFGGAAIEKAMKASAEQILPGPQTRTPEQVKRMGEENVEAQRDMARRAFFMDIGASKNTNFMLGFAEQLGQRMLAGIGGPDLLTQQLAGPIALFATQLGAMIGDLPAAKPIEKVELPPAALEGSVEAYKLAIRQQQQSTQSPDKKIERNTEKSASSLDEIVRLLQSGTAIAVAAL